MKRIDIKKVLFSSVAAAGILLSAAAPVQAAILKTSSIKSIKKNRDYTVKNDASLTKQGYILRIPTNVGKLKNEVISGRKNYNRASQSLSSFKATTVNPDKVKNVKFRVEKVAEFNTKGFGAQNTSLLQRTSNTMVGILKQNLNITTYMTNHLLVSTSL